MSSIIKKLSANDIGYTGGHQAGILIPKQEEILAFFPSLNRTEKNPRIQLTVREKNSETRWDFNLIYYNNKLFGGTRNEYRLTGMTRFCRAADLQPDDELEFYKDENACIYVNIRRSKVTPCEDTDGVLILSGGWKVISL
ncbi:EcoRII N-terminal effector-binding domain-containing protein [Pseudomonas lutea]|uniref:Restriction endonuclease type II EcoRII N-terminal domain-containing protein n=1 Tax=Pseudomonas lutea TaxID=243924 RepID=A0A9X0EI32_9PSED|nr:EcoRII N-terminal effector-binding domain-containing protein [Pseudomonas lutea]KGF66321.1 hypothetical protein LT42_10665 [Pseudomonas lutea]